MSISAISSLSSGTALAGLSPSSLSDPRATTSLPPEKQTAQAAKQFEAILIRQLIGDSVNKLMSGGPGGGGDQMYGYMLTDSLATSIANGGGLGVGKILQQQLTPKGASNPEAKK
ncbi:MAG TPA: flagellar biosynthesis protein FlgJ [Opitutaceae bacterium]|nr:flagellar biosynthesis protein FlgJ [Opitutaceae bacterium]